MEVRIQSWSQHTKSHCSASGRHIDVWQLVKPLDFHSYLGPYKGMDVRTMEIEAGRGTGGAKGRLLESCKIYCRAMEWTKHAMLNEAI